MDKKSSRNICDKAMEYGYSERRAEDIGKARANYARGQQPVAFDTNKTRRKMVMPTRGKQ
jgi:hypothetical protein